MNSSLRYTNITQDDWKCQKLTNNSDFYARFVRHYNNKYDAFIEGLEVCMSNDLSDTRQDITETLYLNITDRKGSQYFRAEANSTLGYFELPSQLNGNIPGPLLDKDPISADSKQVLKLRNSKREDNGSYISNTTLIQDSGKGPLTALTIALFGSGSFVASRLSNPAAFVIERAPDVDSEITQTLHSCTALQPFVFFRGFSANCIMDNETSEGAVVNQVSDWLNTFRQETDDLQSSLEAGLFLANKLWLSGDPNSLGGKNLFLVYHDLGVPTFKPKMSTPGIVVGSIFLGLHLLGLVVLVGYAWIMRPWASSMGADVMLRMGVASADVLGATEGKNDFREATGKLPGYIGDERPGEVDGKMGMGAPHELSRKDGRAFEMLR
jgi:hypothetical protein